MSWKSSGVIGIEELGKMGLLPSKERLAKGPVAVIECPEEIPCNICTSACPYSAIKKGKIYDLPVLDEQKCIGCGVCISKCPGLAIFVVDLSKEDMAYITLPYEMLPAPKRGGEVVLLDRLGREVGKGVVVKAWQYNGTWAVTIKVLRELWGEVRAIKVPSG